jgi:hypothetical protein
MILVAISLAFALPVEHSLQIRDNAREQTALAGTKSFAAESGFGLGGAAGLFLILLIIYIYRKKFETQTTEIPASSTSNLNPIKVFSKSQKSKQLRKERLDNGGFVTRTIQ